MSMLLNPAYFNLYNLRKEAKMIEDSTYVDENMTVVPSGMFQNYLNLTTIYLPNVVEIGENAFNGCTQLSIAEFPKLTKIGSSAFLGCSNLKVVAMFDSNNSQPTATATIGLNAFQNCTNFDTFYLGLTAAPILAGTNPNSVFTGTLLQNSTSTKGNIYVKDSTVQTAYKSAAIWGANNLKSKVRVSTYTFSTNNS